MTRAAVVVVVLTAFAAPSHAGPRVTLEAPATGVGDGRSTVDIVVSVSPASAIARVTDVELRADAGELGGGQPRGQQGIGYRLRLPRVLVDRVVTIDAVVSVGRARLRARARIEVAGVRSPAPTRATGGRFDLRVPAFARLGHQRALELSWRESTEPPAARLVTNLGEVERLPRAADGRMRARLVLPAARYPQVAILALVAGDDSVADWAAVPLMGEARVAIRSEPRASVEVAVGDEVYGPISTGRDGRAAITLAVPPGETRARTLATDLAGNRSEGFLPLAAPSHSRMLVVCPRRGNRVLLITATRAGDDGPELVAETTVGKLTAISPRGEGVFEARLVAPDATAGAGYRVSVAAAGDRAECRGELDSEPARGVSVRERPEEFVAGDGPIGLVLEPEYAGQLPPRPLAARANADFGEVRVSGNQVAWSLPGEYGGRDRARLTIEAPGVAPVALEVVLRAGAPHSVEVVPPARPVVADGHTSSFIAVHAFDRFGNRVAHPRVSVQARGRVSAPRPRADGGVELEYTAPTSHRERGETVRVEVGAATGEARVRWQPLPVPLSVGARAGWITNRGKISSATAAVVALYRLPWLRHRVAIGVELSGYRDRDVRTAPSMVTRETGVMAAPALVRAAMYRGFGPVEGFAAAGVGAVFARTEISAADADSRGSGAGFAGFVGFGASIAAGPGRAELELGYIHAPVDIAGVSGNAGGVRAVAGWRIGL